VERKTRCQNHDTDTADLFLFIQFKIGLCLHHNTGSDNMNFRQTRPTVLSKILPFCLFWSTTILQYVRPRVRGHYSVDVLSFRNRTMSSTNKISENNITSTQQSSSQWAPRQTEHATNTTHIMYNVCFWKGITEYIWQARKMHIGYYMTAPYKHRHGHYT